MSKPYPIWSPIQTLHCGLIFSHQIWQIIENIKTHDKYVFILWTIYVEQGEECIIGTLVNLALKKYCYPLNYCVELFVLVQGKLYTGRKEHKKYKSVEWVAGQRLLNKEPKEKLKTIAKNSSLFIRTRYVIVCARNRSSV